MLFHGTIARNAKSIEEKGILPKPDSYVCASPDYMTALFYAVGRATMEDDYGLVVGFEIHEMWEEDPRAPDSVRSKKPVNPSDILLMKVYDPRDFPVWSQTAEGEETPLTKEEQKEFYQRRLSTLRKVLFVCTGNMDRSPTAESLLKGKQDLEVMSAGTWTHANRVISKDLIDWADLIFAMEQEHKEAILRICPNAGYKVVVLNVPNTFRKNDPELMKILKERLSGYLTVD